MTRIATRKDPADAIEEQAKLRFPGTNGKSIHAKNSIRPECGRSVELATRLGAKLIITDQKPKSAEFERLRAIGIKHPSFDLKLRIAEMAGVKPKGVALEVLRSVQSGMEADIIGHLGAQLAIDTTRTVLLDQFIRLRLGANARAASMALRRFAAFLHDQVAFSMSETHFDEFMLSQDVRFEDCDKLIAVDLLVRRAGRISFSHEMLLNFFSAFALALKAEAEPELYASKLCTPILEPIAGDVISAIENAVACAELLKRLTSASLLSAAASGEFGGIARSISRALLQEATSSCGQEIENAQLLFVMNGETSHIDWVEDRKKVWTEAEEARLCAIGHLASTGAEIDVYLDLCRKMDECLERERDRLKDEARNAKFPLKSQSFALAYYGFHGQIGFTHVARASQNQFWNSIRQMEARDIHFAEMSSGQLHFFLENRHTFFGDSDREHVAHEMLYLIRERFKWEPYHVQLAVMQAVGFIREALPQTVEQVAEAIRSLDVNPRNWEINSAIVDALKMLGALDDEAEGARDQIKGELASVLCDDEDAVDKDFALSLCLRMFDHPFDSIYGQEIHALEENLRRRLYRRSLGAPGINNCFSVSWLCETVTTFGDKSDVSLFQPLAIPPNGAGHYPQDEWGRFIVATRFLGRHDGGLPVVAGDTAAIRCIVEIRKLIYCAESSRLPDVEEARLAWQRLHAMRAQLVVGCLAEIESVLRQTHNGRYDALYKTLRLAHVYVTDCLTVVREFLDEGRSREYYNRAPFREIGIDYVFDVIGHYGDRSDLPQLRKYVGNHPFAAQALGAIKLLDGPLAEF